MANYIHRMSGRRGQAMIETVVALVALLAVFGAMVQLALLGRARSEAMAEARQEAGENALATGYAAPSPEPTFIYNWDVGGDDRSHSADDFSRPALSGPAHRGLLDPMHADELAVRMPGNAFSDLRDRDPVVTGFDFVKGEAQSGAITLLPVVRRLLYNADSIRITSEAWLTWTQEVP